MSGRKLIRGARAAAVTLLVLSLFGLGYMSGFASGGPARMGAGDAMSGGDKGGGATLARAGTAGVPETEAVAVDTAAARSGAGLGARVESGHGEGGGECFLMGNPGRSPQQAIAEAQRVTGAIALRPGDSRIIPYFANLAAMAIVDQRPEDVRVWLEWYLGHLNLPDRWGLYGTVYDYTVDRSGGEIPTRDYDSADSYAATFLTLVRAYMERSGDRDFVTEHLDAIRSVASVIPALQDTDGLVWAKPNRAEKYLMDNAENFRGMVDYAFILSALGLGDEAERALKVAAHIRRGVEERLWNERRGNYDWAVYTIWLGKYRLGEVSRPSDWNKWYPDATAQVFPVICGLLRPSDPRAVSLYQNLNAWHPGWVNQTKTDPHPWSVLGYAAAVMGDTTRAQTFTRATAATYMTNVGPFSELSWELGWHLLTVGLLIGQDVPQAAGACIVPEVGPWRGIVDTGVVNPDGAARHFTGPKRR